MLCPVLHLQALSPEPYWLWVPAGHLFSRNDGQTERPCWGGESLEGKGTWKHIHPQIGEGVGASYGGQRLNIEGTKGDHSMGGEGIGAYGSTGERLEDWQGVPVVEKGGRPEGSCWLGWIDANESPGRLNELSR